MAWVRFPDGAGRIVERVAKVDAEADLNELLARRDAAGEPVPRRQRLASFNDVLDEWLEAGCPAAAAGRRTRRARPKSKNTIANAESLLAAQIRPAIGVLWVDRTRTERIETLFGRMAEDGYATSTIDHAWDYLNQACNHALRRQRIRRSPVEEVLLSEARPAKQRKSLTIEQARRILFEAASAARKASTSRR